MKWPDWMKNTWDPLKRKTQYAIIGAIITVTVVVIVIIFSKLNEVRNHKVPMVWRNRVKDVMRNVDKFVKLAKAEPNSANTYHNITKAIVYMEAAKQLVGIEALPKLSGYDIGKLEVEIDGIYKQLLKSGKIKPKNIEHTPKDNDFVPTPKKKVVKKKKTI